MQQVLAGLEEFFELGGTEVVAADTQGSLHHADGECLTTISEVLHVAALGFEKFPFRVSAVGRDDAVQHVLHLFKVRLTVP